MGTILEGKDRLEDILVRLDRLGRARQGSVRRHVVVPPRPGVGNGAGRGNGPVPRVEPAPAAPADEPVEAPSGLSPGVAEAMDRLVARLDLLEARVSLMGRPVPASREAFAEWVRLRRHEEMTFGDFLKLRRAGLA